MDLVQLLVVDFVIQVYDFSCILLWVALRVMSLLVFTGQLLYNFLVSVTSGIDSALNYLPTCSKGLTRCAIDAGQIFVWHLNEFLCNIRSYMTLWETITACAWLLLIVFSPSLRKIIFSCFAFLIVGSFVILRKLLPLPKFVNNSYNRLSPYSVLAFLFTASFAILKGIVRFFLGRNHNDSTTDSGLSCVACCDRQKCVLLMPCKHVCLCVVCAKSIMVRQRLCPLCRQFIDNSIKIYI